MKKRIFTLLLLVVAMTTNATTFLYNGLYYCVNGDGESVTVVEDIYRDIYVHSYYNLIKVANIPDYAEYKGHSYRVIAISNNAFINCHTLTSVTMGRFVKTIGAYAFFGCDYLKSVAIGSSVESIGVYAFSNCNISGTLVIPNSVKTIGAGAFFGCNDMTTLTIGRAVESIGSEAFAHSYNLTTVNWNAKECNYIDSNSFYYKNIETFIIGDDVEYIPRNLCKGMTKLKYLTVGKSVSHISGNPFIDCPLGEVRWNVKNCTSMSWSPNDEMNDEFHPKWFPQGIRSFIFGDEVEEIPQYLCSGSYIHSVTIPKSVTQIYDNSFEGCTNLREVVWNAKECDQCLAFDGFTNINSFFFGNEVETIPASICRNLINLTSVVIPNSVESINGMAFYGCSGLSSITFSNSAKWIGDRAFEGTAWYDNQQEGLVYAGNVAYNYKGTMPEGTSLVLKNGCTAIANKAFNDCTGMTSVTIPSSLTCINGYAFRNCTGLDNIYTDIDPRNVTCSWLYPFYNVPKNTCVLHVKQEYLNLFKTTVPWKDFYNIVGDYSAINTVEVDGSAREPVGYYDMNGVLHSAPVNGVNIVKYNDGSTEKILMNP